MASAMPALKNAMAQMEASGISGSVAEFEKVFEDMDVQTGVMDQAIEGVYQGSID